MEHRKVHLVVNHQLGDIHSVPYSSELRLAFLLPSSATVPTLAATVKVMPLSCLDVASTPVEACQFLPQYDPSLKTRNSRRIKICYALTIINDLSLSLSVCLAGKPHYVTLKRRPKRYIAPAIYFVLYNLLCTLLYRYLPISRQKGHIGSIRGLS